MPLHVAHVHQLQGYLYVHSDLVSECEIRKKKVVKLSVLYFYQVLHKKQFYTERRIDRIANQVEDCSPKICSRHVSPLNIEKQNRTSQHFVLS